MEGGGATVKNLTHTHTHTHTISAYLCHSHCHLVKLLFVSICSFDFLFVILFFSFFYSSPAGAKRGVSAGMRQMKCVACCEFLREVLLLENFLITFIDRQCISY